MALKFDPPFENQYRKLLSDSALSCSSETTGECELPMIDLSNLWSEDEDRRINCAKEIAKASTEWGFFQVSNHGVSMKVLAEMRREQKRLFRLPFEKKSSSGILNGSYRWGTPTAASLKHFSWSEAFHVPLAKLAEEDCCNEEFNSLREVMEELASSMSDLARTLAGVLAENLGYRGDCFPENCDESTCFLRLNHYPPCPFLPETFGLVPHTDSDFLTILHQDQVGGLQLMKDSKWVAVRPNTDALIVNIGDLFQAWSNDVYRSVEHKVMANAKTERYSVAYFLCPSHDSMIGSCEEASPYKKFTFGEFRKQVQEDVKRNGQKVGLSRFLL
ncbi:uncharacterized protein A4U43_UnF5070 [Asparagus officinalis]|uniref:gibberellin 2beta-dioxygenase n=1 Tax=Asparagus officinalis TaxID=4686 RepID=A0A1R3L6S2_ASPOF|nr:gibberellin 2-beta-dioxygenase 8-like [Asparagus officinalis]ONK55317.1 uncharacterized protein A4U43_UnF5070 [Asparagus officinalis]